MTTTRTLTALVSGALILVPGAALAQSGSTEQSTTQEDRVGAILGTLFGDRLGAVALGTAETVGSAASIVVSTPIAVFDPVTRKNYDDQWRRLGRSVEDTTVTAAGQ